MLQYSAISVLRLFKDGSERSPGHHPRLRTCKPPTWKSFPVPELLRPDDDATSSTSPRTSRPRRHHRSQAHDARVHHRSRVSWEVWKTYAAARISFPSSPGACARRARTIFCPRTSASKPGGRHSTRGLDAPLSFVVEKAYESIPAFQGQKHPVRGRVLAGI